MRHLQTLEMRRAYQTASFQCSVLNALGGKGEGGGQFDPTKHFSTEELLPPWAKPPQSRPRFSRRTARTYLELIRQGKLPAFVISLMDYETMERAAQ